ncbi:hypothetical protein FA95DRAFT_1534854 [Auriscalpium vulgare]|uniref:Uncharacterized protein n=1 Tax=Auriscalpium vulgare TaxID=40419 RepID=A0ACB8S6G7_9AGAM|nr:hypothetical protein FA95DRAFT_1534854 [Auriscalpium vulgare]
MDFLPSHSSSPDALRQQLQALLDSKERQLQQAGALGQRVLAQRVELEERVRLLQALDADKPDDADVNADMRARYRELADTVRAWDDENVLLSSAFGAKRANGAEPPSPPPTFDALELPRDEPERPKPAAGTSAAQSSRRAKNAAHRADDVEFAFEIGSGLLTEVRRLQSLLGERDKAIQDMKEERDDLDKTLESLRNALKSQEQSTDKYKEENWNLEVSLQELRTQFSDAQSSVQRLEGEHKRVTRLLNNTRESTDQYKNEAERLNSALEELKAKHETDIAQARKQAASLQRDKSDLQQELTNAKSEMSRQGRRLPRFGSPLTPEGRERTDLLTPHDREDDDVFSNHAASTNRKRGDTSVMFSADGEYDSSPDVSPSRPFLAPNHPSNEVEALQQRLAHAQRQINTLKGTLQREKELKIEYRKRLESPVAAHGLGAEEDVTDEEQENDEPSAGKKQARKLTPYRVGRGGRGARGGGRGARGRGGLTLIQRLENAARSPASEYDEDEAADVTATPPPPVPSIPSFFHGGAEADDEPEPHYDVDGDDDDEPPRFSPPPSNRTSVDGMDPIFANVLRRSSSSGSLPYNRSPLRNAVVARAAPRRPRGGAAYQEARPASLVGQPEALAAELFGIGMESVDEGVPERVLAEFAVQTEGDEAPLPPSESELAPPPIQVTPAAPETAEFGVQVEPEVLPAPEPAPVLKIETADMSMQTEPEPVPEPEPVVLVERAEAGIQHEPVTPPRVYTESAIATEPLPEPELTPVAPLPETTHAEVQTLPASKSEIEIQTVPTPAVVVTSTSDADVQTSDVPPSLLRADEAVSRRDTITQANWAHDTSGDSTLRGVPAALALSEVADEEYDDGATETGADTDTETEEFHDARASIALTTPTYSMSVHTFHSARPFSDDGLSDEDDTESVKASRYAQRAAGADSRASSAYGRRPDSFYAARQVSYDDQSVQADFVEEPTPVPEPIPLPLPEPPKPELKEMSMQTDEWVPPAPPAPLPVPIPVATPVSRPPSLPIGHSAYKVGNQTFQYISPPNSAGLSPSLSVPPSPIAAVRDSVATIIPAARSSHDRRQSIESTLSGVMDDSTPRSRLPSVGPAPVDKTRPPMMMLPPPPRAPPPSASMPPPNFIPERRGFTSSSSSQDAPGRPISPPPPELLQRATTPTFGSLRGGIPRQHGSSLPPPQQGLGQRPSTNSFRSAANAAAYANGTAVPAGLAMFANRDRERVREMSTTSLHSDHSIGSGRSSMSSDHYFPARSQPLVPNAPTSPSRMNPINGLADTSARSAASTDPTVIHAITQTMIGEFLYKYTRRPMGKGHGEKRHKRFFWVHPYTKTLYWSSADPGSSNVSESSAKSAYIESVRSVLDPNPLPPGLYQYSVIVSTPQREMKITAPTKERHDIWLNALKYLLTRPPPVPVASPGNVANGRPALAPLSPNPGVPGLPEDEPRQAGLLASPQSYRSGRSMQTGESWNITPRGQRSQSQLSVGGSIGKRSGTPAVEYLRWAGPEGPYSPTKSFEHVPGGGEEDDLEFELHDDSLSENGFEGLENVRACCDGRHTVGEHPHHHHHHHQHDAPQQQKRREPSQTRDKQLLDARAADPPRPSSPAWSFRSRAGSATSHDGGFFSGKLRFGSRRSKAAPTGGQDS